VNFPKFPDLILNISNSELSLGPQVSVSSPSVS